MSVKCHGPVSGRLLRIWSGTEEIEASDFPPSSRSTSAEAVSLRFCCAMSATTAWPRRPHAKSEEGTRSRITAIKRRIRVSFIQERPQRGDPYLRIGKRTAGSTQQENESPLAACYLRSAT